MAHKNNAELQAEVRLLRGSRRMEGWVVITRDLIRWGAVAFLGWIVYKCVAVMAGHTTIADIGVRFLGDVRISEALAWVFGAGGVSYGLGQRSLRRRNIRRLTPRTEALEKRLDPRRTSSQLTDTGETHPGDSP